MKSDDQPLRYMLRCHVGCISTNAPEHESLTARVSGRRWMRRSPEAAVLVKRGLRINPARDAACPRCLSRCCALRDHGRHLHLASRNGGPNTEPRGTYDELKRRWSL